MSISGVAGGGLISSAAAGQYSGNPAAVVPADALPPDSVSPVAPNPPPAPPAKFADGVYGVRPEHKHHRKKHHGFAIALGLAALVAFGVLALIIGHGRVLGKPRAIVHI